VKGALLPPLVDPAGLGRQLKARYDWHLFGSSLPVGSTWARKMDPVEATTGWRRDQNRGRVVKWHPRKGRQVRGRNMVCTGGVP